MRCRTAGRTLRQRGSGDRLDARGRRRRGALRRAEAAQRRDQARCKCTGEPTRHVEELISPTGELPMSGLVQLGEGNELVGPSGRP